MDPVAGGFSLEPRFSTDAGDGEAVGLTAGCDWANTETTQLMVKMSGNTDRSTAARCRQTLCMRDEARADDERIFIMALLS
jgi:hypothetical protein